MSPEVFAAFEEMSDFCTPDMAVLELGATPTADTLLNLQSLQFVRNRIGLNLNGPHRCGSFEIIAGQSNAMAMFDDCSFDLVLCNSMLEHDPYFWRTLAEIRRVTRVGGHFLVGVPGYGRMGAFRAAPGRKWPDALAWLDAVAPTLGVHDFPGDFYRFSRQAVEAILLEGFSAVEIRTVMKPPRFIGHGVRS